MGNAQHSPDPVTFTMPEIAAWDKKEYQASIAKHIYIRFKKNKVSLRYQYRDDHNNMWKTKHNATRDELYRHINELPRKKRREYIRTFAKTVSLSSVKSSFRHWKDVESNQLWQNSLDLFLHTIQFDILHALKSGELKRSKRRKRKHRSHA